MLAAGIVQDTFAGEAVESEEETTGGYFYCYSTCTFTAQARKSRFLALKFNSQNTHAHMRIRNRRMYVHNTYLPRSLYIFL